MLNLLLLCWEFFKTGLFSVGGGLATLPFLVDMSERHPEWFTKAQLSDMIAVAESTPGPIGVNMATYAGYSVSGVFGAVLATVSLVLPSVIVIIIIAKAYEKYMKNKYVSRIFSGIRPAVAGLIAAAGFAVMEITFVHAGAAFSLSNPLAFFNLPALAVFAVMLALTQIKYTKKLHPIIYIAVGAVIGIVFGMLK